MRDHLFVYGTLMPGHLRWWMLDPLAVSKRELTVPGTLYDTGHGWPAAVLGDGPGIQGWLVAIEAPSAVELGGLLRRIDAMEGIGEPPDPLHDPYVRRRITLDDGTEAWTYDAESPEAGWTPIERWSDRSDR